MLKKCKETFKGAKKCISWRIAFSASTKEVNYKGLFKRAFMVLLRAMAGLGPYGDWFLCPYSPLVFFVVVQVAKI